MTVSPCPGARAPPTWPREPRTRRPGRPGDHGAGLGRPTRSAPFRHGSIVSSFRTYAPLCPTALSAGRSARAAPARSRIGIAGCGIQAAVDERSMNRAVDVDDGLKTHLTAPSIMFCAASDKHHPALRALADLLPGRCPLCEGAPGLAHRELPDGFPARHCSHWRAGPVSVHVREAPDDTDKEFSMTARTVRIRRRSYDRPARRGPLTLALHRNPRDMTGARTKVAAHSGVLGHLARTTRQNARKGGVVFAAHELFRVKSLLRAFRRQLLETPLEVRGRAHSGALFMTELTIQRAALDVAPHRSEPSHPWLVATRSTRSDLAAGQRNDARAGRFSASSPAHTPRRWGLRTATIAAAVVSLSFPPVR